MSRILVAEDSATQAQQIQFLLEEAGFEVELAGNGLAALQAIGLRAPDLVLTDLDMPEMNGLELVETLRREHASIPVILMTQFGSEEIAVEALQKGASSYVPKRNLVRDIVSTIDGVLVVANAHRHQDWVLECLTQTESQFILENNQDLIPPLIGHLQQNLRRMRLCDEMGLIHMAVALNEALINAIHHGNLEVSSELRSKDDAPYFDLIAQRRLESPYRERRVHVLARESATEAVYMIRDEGPGFDPATLPDPTDPANIKMISGRGLLLIRTFMDEVAHNGDGTQITMIKRRQA
jgi:CheY-like chemotaxis protein